MAFFYNPAASALIEPIVAPGSQAHYDPITYQELQDRKVQLTHETM